ncbi:hypothetical protein [Chryseobacterium sp. 3008163]|uniref:hypothetical protein n=1 Tax=Chryseobacterium sp. 3008163 TaxID=2478663 RepID=UPI001E5A87D9|nr:hypothetical protein [Chryseobacterium sp. 3008163]
MFRRKIKNINGEKVPDKYTNSEDIYKLLEYQTTFLFRLRNKIKLIFQIRVVSLEFFLASYSLYLVLKKWHLD